MSRKQAKIRSSNRNRRHRRHRRLSLLGDRICVYLNVPRHGRAYTIFAFAQYLQTLEGIAAIRPGSGTGVVHLLIGDFLEVASVYVAK